ncbi:MAG: hypothetical protein RIQ33_1383 [Bacteroidota bacterium]|jgi:hypothetical protein
MKKHLLLLLFCFVGLSAFCQSNKINKQDSVSYHFSLKNGWALKINALQPFVYGEFRIQIEKMVSKNNSVEILGSFFVPKFQYEYAQRAKGFDIYGQYTGNRNFKIGLGYIMKLSSERNPMFLELFGFYKRYDDYYDNPSTRQTFFNNTNYNLYYFEKYNYKVFCIQTLANKRINIRHFFIDVFGGVGLRIKYVKYVYVPDDKQFPVIKRDWGVYSEEFNGIYLVNSFKARIFPTIQLGVNIGIQSK